MIDTVGSNSDCAIEKHPLSRVCMAITLLSSKGCDSIEWQLTGVQWKSRIAAATAAMEVNILAIIPHRHTVEDVQGFRRAEVDNHGCSC